MQKIVNRLSFLWHRRAISKASAELAALPQNLEAAVIHAQRETRRRVEALKFEIEQTIAAGEQAEVEQRHLCQLREAELRLSIHRHEVELDRALAAPVEARVVPAAAVGGAV